MSPRSGHFSRSTFRTYARHIGVKWHRCMYVASVTDTVVSHQWWWYVCSGPTHASLHTPQLLSAGAIGRQSLSLSSVVFVRILVLWSPLLLSAGAESVGGRCRCRRSCSYVSSFCGHPCCCPQAQNQYALRRRVRVLVLWSPLLLTTGAESVSRQVVNTRCLPSLLQYITVACCAASRR